MYISVRHISFTSKQNLSSPFRNTDLNKNPGYDHDRDYDPDHDPDHWEQSKQKSKTPNLNNGSLIQIFWGECFLHSYMLVVLYDG